VSKIVAHWSRFSEVFVAPVRTKVRPNPLGQCLLWGKSGIPGDANWHAPPAFRLEIRKSGFKRKAPSDFRSGAKLQLERRSLAGSDHRAGRWPKFSASILIVCPVPDSKMRNFGGQKGPRLRQPYVVARCLALVASGSAGRIRQAVETG